MLPTSAGPFSGPALIPATENVMTEDPRDSAERVRLLNDAFRRSFVGGVVAVTASVEALPRERLAALLAKVRALDAFTEDNDPHGEHDFGVVDDGGARCLWKIDLYEATKVKRYFIAKPLSSPVPGGGRRSRCIRSWPCAPAHRLVSGESESTLFPQSVFTVAESPKAQVADQTTTRPRTAINLPGRQAPAIAPATKVATKLSVMNVFIIGKKRSGEEKVPAREASRTSYGRSASLNSGNEDGTS